jgi:hypothetical protein
MTTSEQQQEALFLQTQLLQVEPQLAVDLLGPQTL